MAQQPRIAAICTTYYDRSHAQWIVDRFFEGYGWDGRHHVPAFRIGSLYVDQIGEYDVSGDRVKWYADVRRYDTIAEALTLGGSKLAVDGVLLIGEHGDYPVNEKGQKLYPRYEFFRQIVEVFKASGRSVPVFCDKHLSWNWDQARWMHDQSRRLGFALMAGSSLPVTRRLPAVDVPWAAEVEQAVCLAYGDVDSYDFHGLEALQCMVERRAGGECGVRCVQTYRGERFWQAHEQGVWPAELVEAALSRSDNVKMCQPGFNYVHPTITEMRQMTDDPIAYHYQHTDGLRCTMMLLRGFLFDFNVALRLKGRAKPLSTQMFLPSVRPLTNQANFFTPLVHAIEQMFVTGRPTYPVERTLLTTGLTAAAVDSLYQDQQRIETPHLEFSYEARPESLFWKC